MPDHLQIAERIAKECACTRARQASRVLSRIYDAALRPIGLQESQLTVLTAIAHFGEAGASMGNLARVLLMERTTLTRNLVPLEKAELVRVARSPHDARTRMVFLSRAGERMIVTALPLWERAQKRVREKIGPRLMKHVSEDLDDLLKRSAAGLTEDGE
jgi:DNA-binding MarR family transcriptional regulator